MSEQDQSIESEWQKEGECWILICSTGCTCCRHENFIQGPYFTEDEADKEIQRFISRKRLSSQYSESGRYTKAKIPYEIAGRWLILEETYALRIPATSLLDGTWPPLEADELDCYRENYRL